MICQGGLPSVSRRVGVGGGACTSEVVPGLLRLSCPLFFTSTLPQSRCASVSLAGPKSSQPSHETFMSCSAAAPVQKGHRGLISLEPCINTPAYNKHPSSPAGLHLVARSLQDGKTGKSLDFLLWLRLSLELRLICPGTAARDTFLMFKQENL